MIIVTQIERVYWFQSSCPVPPAKPDQETSSYTSHEWKEIKADSNPFVSFSDNSTNMESPQEYQLCHLSYAFMSCNSNNPRVGLYQNMIVWVFGANECPSIKLNHLCLLVKLILLQPSICYHKLSNLQQQVYHHFMQHT